VGSSLSRASWALTPAQCMPFGPLRCPCWGSQRDGAARDSRSSSVQQPQLLEEVQQLRRRWEAARHEAKELQGCLAEVRGRSEAAKAWGQAATAETSQLHSELAEVLDRERAEEEERAEVSLLRSELASAPSADDVSAAEAEASSASSFVARLVAQLEHRRAENEQAWQTTIASESEQRALCKLVTAAVVVMEAKTLDVTAALSAPSRCEPKRLTARRRATALAAAGQHSLDCKRRSFYCCGEQQGKPSTETWWLGNEDSKDETSEQRKGKNLVDGGHCNADLAEAEAQLGTLAGTTGVGSDSENYAVQRDVYPLSIQPDVAPDTIGKAGDQICPGNGSSPSITAASVSPLGPSSLASHYSQSHPQQRREQLEAMQADAPSRSSTPTTTSKHPMPQSLATGTSCSSGTSSVQPQPSDPSPPGSDQSSGGGLQGSASSGRDGIGTPLGLATGPRAAAQTRGSPACLGPDLGTADAEQGRFSESRLQGLRTAARSLRGGEPEPAPPSVWELIGTLGTLRSGWALGSIEASEDENAVLKRQIAALKQRIDESSRRCPDAAG